MGVDQAGEQGGAPAVHDPGAGRVGADQRPVDHHGPRLPQALTVEDADVGQGRGGARGHTGAPSGWAFGGCAGLALSASQETKLFTETLTRPRALRPRPVPLYRSHDLRPGPPGPGRRAERPAAPPPRRRPDAGDPPGDPGRAGRHEPGGAELRADRGPRRCRQGLALPPLEHPGRTAPRSPHRPRLRLRRPPAPAPYRIAAHRPRPAARRLRRRPGPPARPRPAPTARPARPPPRAVRGGVPAGRPAPQGDPAGRPGRCRRAGRGRSRGPRRPDRRHPAPPGDRGPHGAGHGPAGRGGGARRRGADAALHGRGRGNVPGPEERSTMGA